jgi:cytochrome c biogenesis protein CcmG, thiol:disulfide interchange protein DsbE
MSKQWLAVVAVVVGLLAGALALTKFGPDIELVEVGSRAPNFRAIDLATGDSVSFREHYEGAVTLVNIWATWCIPCRVEMPGMDSVYQALAPRGFKIAAVSIDEGSPEEVRAFAQELGISFDLLQDRQGVVQQLYQTTGVPESFLVNKDGIIVKRLIGEHAWNSPANRNLIETLLDETGG